MPWPQRVKSRLDSLMSDELLSTSQLGMCVYDITADSLLYGHNMQQTLRPASTEKLLTAITALHVLGGSFRFVTSLYVDGEVRDSVLYGNVYIKGGMDPAFGHDDMRAFANSLIEKGIYRIDGEIVADISFKDTLLGQRMVLGRRNGTAHSPALQRQGLFHGRVFQCPAGRQH